MAKIKPNQIVVINRGCAERRYCLGTEDPITREYIFEEPYYYHDFEKIYGFSPEWPHEEVKEK